MTGMAALRELGPEETGLAYATMRELRLHLASEAEFVERVNALQRAEGYRLVGSFVEGQDEPVAVAGFRFLHALAWGHVLYVDDLVTREAFRQQGHAAALIQWLIDEARRLGCDQFHLDSGVHRHAAHRFYLNQRMRITAYHFARELASKE
jgi:GNAT superfamily N-acetyltransferase